uniref:Uncharacterized protein n=1 Tax=Eutreptiella gymnastica TaxID=73025 RepID=A0A7S1I9F3_9EUGL|mmetsp:Transcript_139367/g.242332  ORF Transcript_139367/g.242332 Transcript_139367/m.242332 type:complete len:133 (+) Transcript_139367:168-566(+)
MELGSTLILHRRSPAPAKQGKLDGHKAKMIANHNKMHAKPSISGHEVEEGVICLCSESVDFPGVHAVTPEPGSYRWGVRLGCPLDKVLWQGPQNSPTQILAPESPTCILCRCVCASVPLLEFASVYFFLGGG